MSNTSPEQPDLPVDGLDVAALEALQYGESDVRMMVADYDHRRRLIVDGFRDLGLPLSRAMVTNGGSKSTLWKQIHADVLGTDLHPIVDHPGASFGAAVIAAIGVGLIDEWTDVDRYISLGPTVHPDPALTSQYDAAYREWRELGAALTPFSHSLSRKAHS